MILVLYSSYVFVLESEYSDVSHPKMGFHDYLSLDFPEADLRKDLNASCLFGK